MYSENVIHRDPPSGSAPVARRYAAEDVWLKCFDVAAVVPHAVLVSGANILAVDGTLGVELYVTDRIGRLLTVAFLGPANRIHDEMVVSEAPANWIEVLA